MALKSASTILRLSSVQLTKTRWEPCNTLRWLMIISKQRLLNIALPGPFHKVDIPDTHISRFGVIPKQHKPNKWRLIMGLSHPIEFSVNYGISKELCSLSYITVDTAIDHIIELGPRTLLAKMDIKSAFCLLPMHPSDRHLLVMEWKCHVRHLHRHLPSVWPEVCSQAV